jgi:hypothetical protein
MKKKSFVKMKIYKLLTKVRGMKKNCLLVNSSFVNV